MEGKKRRDNPLSERFTWTIENFSRLYAKKIYSESFYVGEHKWRVLVFPRGNNVDHLSIYLDAVDSATLPYGWSRYAQFSLSVINQIHYEFQVGKETHHQFNARESDWGFASIMPLSELYDPGRGYLVNDTCIVEAYVTVIHSADDYLAHDLKVETGHVELQVEAAKTALGKGELLRSSPMGSHPESSSFDDMDAYISELVSVVETDAPFDSTTEGSVAASIAQSTIVNAKKFFIEMLSRSLSEISDFAADLTESISVLSKCCDLTPVQLAALNTLQIEFPTLVKTYQNSKHFLKEVDENMSETQGTKNSLVEQVKVNAFAFQMQRAMHKDLITKEASLQAELAKISEKKKSAEKEMKQLHGKMVNLEQSRSSVLEEISTLVIDKKTVEGYLSLIQQKWTELGHIFKEPNN